MAQGYRLAEAAGTRSATRMGLGYGRVSLARQQPSEGRELRMSFQALFAKWKAAQMKAANIVD